jgi:hypothetical protein
VERPDKPAAIAAAIEARMLLAYTRERTGELVLATEALRLRSAQLRHDSAQLRHDSAQLHSLVTSRCAAAKAVIAPGRTGEV